MSSAAQDRVSQVSGHLRPSGKLLEGEVAIITGAAQGIGRSAALLFASEGGKIVVSDLDEGKAKQVVDEISKAGGQAIAVGGDVTAADFPKRIVEATVSKFGKINHLVLNAGFTYDKMAHGMDDATFELMLKVHNTAPFRLVREAAPYLRIKDAAKRENRSLVFVSSTSGLHGNVGQINYSVAKAGVVGMCKTLAKEWGPFGVRANTVAYGWVETRLTAAKEAGAAITVDGKKIALGIPQQGDKARSIEERAADIPLRRPGTADEAAAAMLFLVSPLSSYVSGHVLEVTGGRGI